MLVASFVELSHEISCGVSRDRRFSAAVVALIASASCATPRSETSSTRTPHGTVAVAASAEPVSKLSGPAPTDELDGATPAEKLVSDRELAARSAYRQYAPQPLPARLAFNPSWHLSFLPNDDSSTIENPEVLGASSDWVVIQHGQRVLVLSPSDGARLSETSVDGADTLVFANWLILVRTAAEAGRVFVYELPSLRELSRTTLSDASLWLGRGRMLQTVESRGVRLLADVNGNPWGSGNYGGSTQRELLALRDGGAVAWRRLSSISAVTSLAADAERFYVASPREIQALDPATGQALWTVAGSTQPLEEPCDDASAVAVDGAVVFADGGRVLRRLDAKTGASVWEHPLGKNEVSSMVAHDGIVYAAVKPADKSQSELIAVDARKGKLLWRRAATGKRLAVVGPEGVTLLGAVDAHEGIALLDRRTGNLRALFRVGDGDLSLARAVDATGAAWMFASTATHEVLGLRLGAPKPLPAPVTVRGRVFFGDRTSAEFTLVRDANEPLRRREEIRTEADGSYETIVRAHDVIEIQTRPKELEELKRRIIGADRPGWCWTTSVYVRSDAILAGEQFDVNIGCSRIER